jgi:hypothetical protein
MNSNVVIDLKTGDPNRPIHLTFPGVFSERWLYVDGKEVSHRDIRPIWWYNHYQFEWDVDLTGKVESGTNKIAPRVNNPHHFGGICRRPFLYRRTGN